MTEDFIKQNISTKRLESYNDEEEYKKNIKLSNDIYGLLSIFEISLRNRVFSYFKGFYQCDIDSVLGNIANNFKTRINSHSLETINSSNLSPDQKISQLNLGFWVSLFSYKDEKENKLLNNYIPNGKVFSKQISFRALSSICNIKNEANIDVHDLEARYTAIKLVQTIRNRAFHHENLFKQNNSFPRISHRVSFNNQTNARPNVVVGIRGDKIVEFLKFMNKYLDKRLMKDLLSK